MIFKNEFELINYLMNGDFPTRERYWKKFNEFRWHNNSYRLLNTKYSKGGKNYAEINEMLLSQEYQKTMCQMISDFIEWVRNNTDYTFPLEGIYHSEDTWDMHFCDDWVEWKPYEQLMLDTSLM